MTIGQRIAQKRKELGLSQEALGEKLGVSRQSIYKWESDAALPEIDKLIALSKLFGISIGVLLGVEEEAAEADKAAEPSPDLTEAQLKMVEEITQRYISALPKPPRQKKRTVLRVLAVGCVLFAAWQLYARLQRTDEQYRLLTSQISDVQMTVENRIDGISHRVESILKAQNDLVADYETGIVATDLAKGLVTFSFRAVPKAFTADTIAYLEISNEGVIETFGPFTPEENQTFRGEVVTALTDDIVLSVVFETDGVRSTQLLEEYNSLFLASLPELYLESDFWRMRLSEPYVLTFPSIYNEGQIVYTRRCTPGEQLAENEPPAEAGEIRVGLFKNQTLVVWAEPIPKPANYQGFEDCAFYRFPDLTLPLTDADLICAAAVITDQYGRTAVMQDGLFRAAEEGTLLDTPDSYSTSSDPADWGL